MIHRLLFTLAAPLLLAWSGWRSPPPTDEGTPPSDPPAAETLGAAEDAAVQLLDRLERAGEAIRSLDARILYLKQNPLTDEEERVGRVLYLVDPASDRKRVAVLFESERIGDRQRARTVHYVFDGSWLAEIDRDEKQFIKRQIVPPGEQFDPLRLGEGPLPLPIGQKKEDVLARFEAARIEPPAEGFLANRVPAEALGLELVPRPGTAEAEDFRVIRIYHDPTTLLPIAVDAEEVGGERQFVLVAAPRINEPIDESLLDTTPPTSGWRVDVRPWRSDRE